MNARRRARAFSMLEVLVAAGLLAVIGGLMMQTLSQTIDGKESVENISNRYTTVRSAMSRMVDELSMAYLSAHVSSTEARSQTGFKGEKDKVDFTAFGYVPRVEDEKKGDSRQLGYYVDSDSKSGTNALWRREDPNLDGKFDSGGRRLVLLTGVRELTFEYWDVQKEAWAEKWDASSSEANRLPARVRIKLVAVMADGEEQTFITQSKLHLLSPLSF